MNLSHFLKNDKFMYETRADTEEFCMECWKVANALVGHESALESFLSANGRPTYDYGYNIVSLCGNHRDEDRERVDNTLGYMLNAGLAAGMNDDQFFDYFSARIWDLAPTLWD